MVDQNTLLALYERPGFMLNRGSQAAGGYFERACAELGLTTRQYDVLFVLHAEDGVDQDRLARILGLDKSNTGLVVGNLERKGLLRRVIKPGDRRKRSLSISAEGLAVYQAARPHAEEAKERLLAPLSKEERRQLLRLLKKLVLGTTASERAPLELVEA